MQGEFDKTLSRRQPVREEGGQKRRLAAQPAPEMYELEEAPEKRTEPRKFLKILTKVEWATLGSLVALGQGLTSDPGERRRGG